jgi:hypothetical protein
MDQRLVDVAVEHRRVRVLVEDRERLVAVLGEPVPRLGQREQRPVREHEQRAIGRDLGDFLLEPRELLIADATLRVRHVVERDQVHTLELARLVGRAEHGAERLAGIGASVVLAGITSNRCRRRPPWRSRPACAPAASPVMG